MSGKTLTFSEFDIRKTAAAYFLCKASAPAPLVLGHPVDNRPAYGEVIGLIEDGGKLFAHADVTDSLVDMVRAGSYRYVSASFFAPDEPGNPAPGVFSLRHVGFLGALPPAVKGIAALNFAAGMRRQGICFTEGIAASADAWSRQYSDASGLAQKIEQYRTTLPNLSYLQVCALATNHATKG